MKRRWHKIIGVGLGLLVLAGLVGGSMALAQGPQDEPPRFGGPRWHGLCFIEVTAQELGPEMEALIERLRDGESLSDIAAEQGKALRDLTDAFLAAQDEALTEAADQGYFTPARADWGQQRLHQRTEQFLAGFGWRHGLLAPVGLEAAAEVLGMTKEELRDEIHEGKTIAGLAERQGVTLESISEALQAAREEALTRAVEEGQSPQSKRIGFASAFRGAQNDAYCGSGQGTARSASLLTEANYGLIAPYQRVPHFGGCPIAGK